MHVELILEEPALADDSQDVIFESFRRTSWAIWSKGKLLAVSGRSYRHRATALAALERVTGRSVQHEWAGGWQPVALQGADGRRIPIERVR